MEQFQWIPGKGVDTLALRRLRSQFRRPDQPMGEAWFMGEQRRMFTELLGDLDKLTASELQEPLVEIASGTSSFGPQEEWHKWYHYLLGELLARSHEAFVSYTLECLITAFMAVYPNGIYQEPYKGFRDDALLTLGRCMMDSQCWDGSDISLGNVLHRSNNNPNRVWVWWDASGDFSASMFFCLKYLPEPLVVPWLRSVLAIPSPHWRAQIIAWMVGAKDILNGSVKWPSQFPENARPSVEWDGSHCLRPELSTADDSGAPPASALIPEGSRLQALSLFESYFDNGVYLNWLTSISTVSYLETELAEIPATFETLYVRPARR
ncbi:MULTISPECIES: hypothetical protein [Cupriavidus]|jgi:hypothetical protein|uniref:Uncharacterized protein n=1 Tax=Cupriavidus metallidurans TaxID=119219 RepID=A0A482ISG7_9BURK|nr:MULTISPECIES: hypothetical protein [Cupriavidus]KWR78275.1 hypothetical protein RN01_24510 [Cupriavidus sp. SHE]QBP09730.1 hypothetical protein DDF84_008140 [Cupriavidus metallidurans]QWC90075.1 hypothetical protein KB891_07790 [Cupriavidus metallidurans]